MRHVAADGAELAMREATAFDRAFIASRWVRSYSAERAGLKRAEYRHRMNPLVSVLLRRSRVVVLCSPREPAAVFGFAVAERDVLHFVYVEPKLWARGLGRELVTEALGSYPAQIKCSHTWRWPSDRYVSDWWWLLGIEESRDERSEDREAGAGEGEDREAGAGSVAGRARA